MGGGVKLDLRCSCKEWWVNCGFKAWAGFFCTVGRMLCVNIPALERSR